MARMRRWTKRQPLSAAHLNEVIDQTQPIVDKFSPQASGNPYHGGDQIRILGRITTAGPNGEADFDDARYWVQVVFIVRGDDWTSEIEIDDVPDVDPGDDGDTVPQIFPVTNLPELPDNTHGLAVDTPVVFWEEQDQADWTSDNESNNDPPDNPPNPRFVMAMGAPADEGQYQGEVNQMVAQRVPGWGYTPIVAELDD